VALARRAARGLLDLAPVQDGDLFGLEPVEAVAQGAALGVPLLVGATLEEFTMLSRFSRIDQATARAALAALGLSEPGVDAYLDRHGDDAVGQAVTDRVFRLPAQEVATARAVAGGPTFAYDFRWRSPFLDGLLGACHCLDVPFAFDNVDGTEEGLVAEAPRTLVDAVHGAWLSFVTTGDPGWAAYDTGRRTTMVFDEASAAEDDPLAEVRAAWSTHG
jgi:para-nitrobenzyl esterase